MGTGPIKDRIKQFLAEPRVITKDMSMASALLYEVLDMLESSKQTNCVRSESAEMHE